MPAGPLRLDHPRGVLAVDLGGTKIDAAVCDLTGRFLARRRVPMDTAGGPESVLAKIASLASELTAEAGCDLAARTVVLPGVLRDDVLLHAPNLPGWDRIKIGASLTELLGAPVLLCNDVRAAAMAEATSGALVDADPAIYVNVGTGLAAALIVDGKIVGGAHGSAGEIGYMSIDGIGPEHDGAPPLEEAVSGLALKRKVEAMLGRSLTTQELFERPSIEIDRIVDEMGAVLATAIADLCLLVDPQAVALGGGVMRSGDRILDAVRQRCASVSAISPVVDPARHLHDASLHGAIALAVEAAVSPVLPVDHIDNRQGNPMTNSGNPSTSRPPSSLPTN